MLFLHILLLCVYSAGGIASLFEPIAEVVRSLDLPDWLVHWGHPGNMVRYSLACFFVQNLMVNHDLSDGFMCPNPDNELWMIT